MQRLRSLLFLVLWLAAEGVGHSSAISAPRFAVSDIGPNEPASINAQGHVVGPRDHPDKVFWVWDGTQRKTYEFGGAQLGTPKIINDRGDVVGMIQTRELYNNPFIEPAFITRGFLWTNGQFIDLGGLGGLNCLPKSLNNLRIVVGTAQDTQQRWRAFVWQSGQMLDLQTFLPLDSGWTLLDAVKVTEDGIIYGLGELTGQRQAFRLTPQSKETYKVQSLGVITGAGTELIAFNNLGQGVGSGDEAFLIETGSVRHLGNLGEPFSYACGINDFSQVVGESNSHAYRAFLWEAGVMFDCNNLVPPESGWTLVSATAISETGSIIGLGNHEGTYRAFLMRPMMEPAPALVVSGQVSEGTFQFHIVSGASRLIALEFSSDFSNWKLLTNLLSTSSVPALITDMADINTARRFYRASFVP